MALSDDQMLARLNRALAVGGNAHMVCDIVDAVRSGRMQAFSRDDAFVVTEIVCFPRKTVLNVYLIAGELEAIMEMQPEVIAFARAHGCDAMTLTARKGFARVLPKWGWTVQPLVNCVMPLKDEQNG